MDALSEVRELTVAEAAERGVAGLVSDAEQGGAVVLTRRTSFDDVLAVVENGDTLDG